MAENTKIEWADHTFNPWIGCTKVSPACDNCYAESLMDKRYGRAKWGPGEPRVRTGAQNWRQPIRWNLSAAAGGTRPFVFCASLADVFDNEVTPSLRADLFRLIDGTPNLVWLLLTKRIGNVNRMVTEMGGLPRNVAIGATMATQAEYDRDARKLFEVKEELSPLFTFGSFEPLLEQVFIDGFAPDWIIVGGESGPNARPMENEWAQSIVDQCAAADVPCFVKQLSSGGSKPIKDIADFPERLRVREFPA